jgi:hypothetical protein
MSRRPPRWSLVAPLAIALLVVAGGPARADKVDSFIAQLAGSADYKIRLSAALSLAKTTDPRAVPAFVRALNDADKTVRGVAAAALGKQVNCDTRPGDRRGAESGLTRAATRDGNDFVRKQADKALQSIRALGCGAAIGAGSTYVNVGKMTATGAGGEAMRKLMRRAVQKTFQAKARTMATEWPGGGEPTASQLKAKKVTAFHVDGTLNEVTVDGTGGGATVSCKVSMLLATYPEKSMFGFLKGGAQVQGGGSAADIQYAKEDCVSAVLEDLIARKIIPTIQARATP